MLMEEDSRQRFSHLGVLDVSVRELRCALVRCRYRCSAVCRLSSFPTATQTHRFNKDKQDLSKHMKPVKRRTPQQKWHFWLYLFTPSNPFKPFCIYFSQERKWRNVALLSYNDILVTTFVKFENMTETRRQSCLLAIICVLGNVKPHSQSFQISLRHRVTATSLIEKHWIRLNSEQCLG